MIQLKALKGTCRGGGDDSLDCSVMIQLKGLKGTGRREEVYCLVGSVMNTIRVEEEKIIVLMVQ